MIISASRRTDIPAFYGDWLLNRLKAGEVLVRNPMQSKQVSRIMLTPDTVDALVFWTKNPEHFLSHLPQIDALGYSYYFLFTLTPYDATLEPGVPEKTKMLEVFRRLSRLIGPERVVWRYDPVVLTDRYTPEWHIEAFSLLARELSGYTGRCIISFLDDYRKIRSRMHHIGYILPDKVIMGELAGQFADASGKRGITLFTCSQDIDLSSQGIMHSRCIDSELVERISGRRMKGIKKDIHQRHGCGCIESRDIGSYNTCGHGCLYCYASSGHAKACVSSQVYDSASPMLCDQLRGDEVITIPVFQKRSLSAYSVFDAASHQGELFTSHQP
jgi:hypothetical protein